MCTFFSKTIVKRTQPGMRQSVQHEGEETKEAGNERRMEGTADSGLDSCSSVCSLVQ